MPRGDVHRHPLTFTHPNGTSLRAGPFLCADGLDIERQAWFTSRMNTASNSHGDTFAVGDQVRWDSTDQTHTGTIKRFDADGTALVIGGAYEAVHVDLDSLYR